MYSLPYRVYDEKNRIKQINPDRKLLSRTVTFYLMQQPAVGLPTYSPLINVFNMLFIVMETLPNWPSSFFKSYGHRLLTQSKVPDLKEAMAGVLGQSETKPLDHIICHCTA